MGEILFKKLGEIKQTPFKYFHIKYAIYNFFNVQIFKNQMPVFT